MMKSCTRSHLVRKWLKLWNSTKKRRRKKIELHLNLVVAVVDEDLAGEDVEERGVLQEEEAREGDLGVVLLENRLEVVHLQDEDYKEGLGEEEGEEEEVVFLALS